MTETAGNLAFRPEASPRFVLPACRTYLSSAKNTRCIVVLRQKRRFNSINLHLYHYAGNNPVRYTDPNGREEKDSQQKIEEAIINNLNFTCPDSMGCDKFVTKILTDPGVKPPDWLDPNTSTVKDYRDFYKSDLSKVASKGWNITIMISDNPSVLLADGSGRVVDTDPTPHMGLTKKNEDGSLILVHYTHGKVVIQNFKDEKDFVEKMPFEVYVYDTAEFKEID